MGGAPTFAIEPKFVTKKVKEKIETVSNYTTNHSNFYVFRLSPECALHFFGNKAKVFYDSIKELDAPLNIKYKMIGNMFSPDQAFTYTKEIVTAHIQ